MADKKEANEHDKKDGKDAAADAKKGKPSPMAPIAAGLVLLLVGGGVGFAASKVMSKWAVGGDSKTTEGAAHGESGAHGAEAEHGGNKSLTLHEMAEIVLPDLMSNVKNQQGRRFIKVACALWIEKKMAVKLGLAAEGGGHGGGEAVGGDVKRIIQQALEEQLKGYDLEELTGSSAYVQLKKGFMDTLERELHATFPHEPDDVRFVERVVLTNLLVQ